MTAGNNIEDDDTLGQGFFDFELPSLAMFNDNWDEPERINALRRMAWASSFSSFILASAVVMNAVRPDVVARTLYEHSRLLREQTIDSLMGGDENANERLKEEVMEVLSEILRQFKIEVHIEKGDIDENKE